MPESVIRKIRRQRSRLNTTACLYELELLDTISSSQTIFFFIYRQKATAIQSWRTSATSVEVEIAIHFCEPRSPYVLDPDIMTNSDNDLLGVFSPIHHDGPICDYAEELRHII